MMNGLLTIEHDFSTPYMDDNIKRHRQWYEIHGSQIKAEYQKRKVSFIVNPLWKHAFTGRSEYAAG